MAETIRELRARRERVAQVLAKVYTKLPRLIDDHEFGAFHPGVVKDEAELAAREEHHRLGVAVKSAAPGGTGCRRC